MSDDEFWDLTFGQFYKLQDRQATLDYNRRFDLAAFHASFITANSKKGSATTTPKKLIGGRPILSDERPDEILSRDMLQVFRDIFPDVKGSANTKPAAKKKKERRA